MSSLFVWSLAKLLPASRALACIGRVVPCATFADVPAEADFDENSAQHIFVPPVGVIKLRWTGRTLVSKRP